jgi:predicted transcriptional regulator
MMHVAAGALVHPNTIQRYEAGDSSMSIESVERVLKVLGYELEAISIEK